jgi:hypothetical protein
MSEANTKRSTVVLAVACGLLLWNPGTARSSSTASSVYDIQAALLSHFATFVEWPQASFTKTGGNFAICIFGRDPFGPRLERTFEGKTVSGHEVTIHRSTSLRALSACHVLFVSLSEAKQVAAVVRALAGRNVLTVSEIDRFVDRGGMIQLNRSGSRVQFEINKSTAERARLKISPQLLKLASDVRTSRSGR